MQIKGNSCLKGQLTIMYLRLNKKRQKGYRSLDNLLQVQLIVTNTCIINLNPTQIRYNSSYNIKVSNMIIKNSTTVISVEMKPIKACINLQAVAPKLIEMMGQHSLNIWRKFKHVSNMKPPRMVIIKRIKMWKGQIIVNLILLGWIGVRQWSSIHKNRWLPTIKVIKFQKIRFIYPTLSPKVTKSTL